MLLMMSTYSQTLDEKYGEDVKSIDAIINAYYDVISGASTDPWQFERDKYLHSQDALIIHVDEKGKLIKNSLEAEYIPFLLSDKESFYEVEVNRIVKKYGNMAQVWSTYEIRNEPEVASDIRGQNSIQLYFSEGRWWISGWTTQLESKKHPIPE
jgi:hypothetical protein